MMDPPTIFRHFSNTFPIIREYACFDSETEDNCQHSYLVWKTALAI